MDDSEYVPFGFLSSAPQNRTVWVERRLRGIAARFEGSQPLPVSVVVLAGVPCDVADQVVPDWSRPRSFSFEDFDSGPGSWDRPRRYAPPSRTPLERVRGVSIDGSFSGTDDLSLSFPVAAGPSLLLECPWSHRWVVDFDSGAGVATGFHVRTVPLGLSSAQAEVFAALRGDGWKVHSALTAALAV